MRTLITGATGFIGRHLLPHFKRPVVLSRFGSKGRGVLNPYDVTAYDWTPVSGPPPLQAFDNVDVVIHLAGEPVAGGRWTKAKRQRIFSSRVTGTSHLVQAIRSLPHPPRLLISASAVGYYGSRGEELLRESSGPGHDFLADVCVAWEAAALAAAQAGVRVVLPRIGVVLGPDGGVMEKLLKPFRFGLGGKLGSGTQWMPWIHVEDLAQIFLFLNEHDTVSGAVNAVAPGPVTNAQFTTELGKRLHRPTWFSTPAPLLRMVLGQFADIVLASQRVVPEVLSRAGFAFQYPELPAALKHAVGS
jgi:uncharacterized protein (TIGR01777 family)